jgi:hypothetical protein
MDDIFAVIVFLLFVVGSAIFNKIRTAQQNSRMDQEVEVDPDDLPEATRRMLYGEPRTARQAPQRREVPQQMAQRGFEAEEEEEEGDGMDSERMPQPMPAPQQRARPIPVADPARRVPLQGQQPRQQTRPEFREVRVEQIPARRPAPPAPPRPMPQQRPMPRVQQMPTRRMTPVAEDSEDFEQRERIRHQREMEETLTRQKRQLAETQARAKRVRQPQAAEAKAVVQRMLGSKRGLAYSVVLSEILGPPLAMRQPESGRTW